MRKILLVSLTSLIISCDYAKQQKELTELKLQNIELNKKVKRYKLDSLFKSSETERNPDRLRAKRIIDSLKFSEPKTYEFLEEEIMLSNSYYNSEP